MKRADHGRIAALEQWHATRDCEERGHIMPDGYTSPDPSDLADVRETVDISEYNAPNQTITTLIGLPAHVVEVPCDRCGTTLLATQERNGSCSTTSD